eukprot:TRINITY_DN4303_c0_g1_i2.p1 TRINITY_DN4303_c0_g1~~TRINITY_DN4303_c0_g1_i2.p1  ORF type:complete len:487 (+),score=112.59 TRINITY_DN4303_c0_g1_i2:49-1509(+)
MFDGDLKDDEFVFDANRTARNAETLRRNGVYNSQINSNVNLGDNSHIDIQRHIDQRHIDQRHIGDRVENHYHIGAVDGARDIARLLSTSSAALDSSSSVAHLDAIMKAAGLILQEISGVYSDHLDVQAIILAAQAHHTKLSRQTSLILYDLYKFAETIIGDLPLLSALLKVGQIDAAIHLCSDLLTSSRELEHSLQDFVAEFEVIPELLQKAYGKASRSVSALNHRIANAKMFGSIFGSIGGTALTVGALSVPISNGASWRFFMNECSFPAKCGITLMALLPIGASMWSNRAGQKFEEMIAGFEAKMQEIQQIHKELDMQARLLKIMNENLKLAIESQKKICSMAKMSRIATTGHDKGEDSVCMGYKIAACALDVHVGKAKQIWSKIAESLKMRDLASGDELVKLIRECRTKEEKADSATTASTAVTAIQGGDSRDAQEEGTDASAAAAADRQLMLVPKEDSSIQDTLEQEWTSKLSTPFAFQHMF